MKTKVTKSFINLDKYEKQQESEALKISKEMKLGLVPSKIGDQLNFSYKIGNVQMKLSIRKNQLKELAQNKNEKLGQLTVYIYNYKLKNDREMSYNDNNIGLSPWESKWDNEEIPTIKAGEIVEINACEYGVGDGGTMICGKFRSSLSKEESTLILKKYRTILIEKLF